MKISILDQAPVSKGFSATEALQTMAESARLADRLGYHRFWIAEHHNTDSVASSAPEVSMAYLAGQTERIRLGSGGTMMMHYSPYKMAEVFKTLSAYAPGRIDFGGGRAPGGDGKSILALSEGRDTTQQDLYSKFINTINLINDEPGLFQEYQHLVAQPTNIQLPQPFILGSTGNSAAQAGYMGAGYAYVQFFNGQIDKTVFDAYRNRFRPSAYFEKPLAIACYFVTTGDSKEEAEFHGLPADISRLLLYRGQHIARMSPEDAQHFPLSDQDRLFIESSSSWHLKGSVDEVAEYLKKEQKRYEFDEVMICTTPFSKDYKLASYEKLKAALS